MNNNDQNINNKNTNGYKQPQSRGQNGYAQSENRAQQNPNSYAQPQYRPQQNPNGYAQPQYRPQQNPNGYAQPQYRPQQNPNGYAQPQYRPQQNPNGYAQPQYRPQQNPNSYAQPQYRPQQNPNGYAQPQYRPQPNPNGYAQPQQAQQNSDNYIYSANTPAQSDNSRNINTDNTDKKQKSKGPKTPKGGGKKKIIIPIIAVILVIAIVAGAIGIGIYSGKIDTTDYDSEGAFSSKSEAHAVADVKFKDNVYIVSDVDSAQDGFENVVVNGDKYTVCYTSGLPEELSSLKEGSIFCFPSDAGNSIACFEMGFCGRVVSKDADSITFTVPSMEEVFSDFSLCLDGDVADYADFTPAQGVRVAEYIPASAPAFQSASANFIGASASGNGTIAYNDEVTIGDYTFKPDFKYVAPTQSAVLPGYNMLCDKLKLELGIERKNDDYTNSAITGSVELEDLAVKMDIAWNEDANGNVNVERYDVGFAAYTKTKVSYKDTLEVGLDDLPFIGGGSSPIIEVVDVTAAESGKIVLGSYVFGFEADVPGFDNDTNKISYLSAGIVVQLSVTAKGELSIECSLDNSGFYMAELSSENGFTGLAKSYDYPSPVLYTGEYTEEQQASLPETKMTFEGSLELNAAIGLDVGICIFGMVPVKFANNIYELDIVSEFSEEYSSSQEVDTTDKTSKLLDDNIESIALKTNSTLKFHLGAKVNFIGETTLFDVGVETVIFNKDLYRYPETIPFDHSQCGFGNVFVGDYYTTDEIEATFRAFEEEAGIDSVISDIKDGAGNVVIETFTQELGLMLGEIDPSLDAELDGSLKYYSSGAIYIVDGYGRVSMAIVTGEDIYNEGGYHPGVSIKKTEQLYGSPDFSEKIEFEMNEVLRYVLNEAGIPLGETQDIDLTVCSYKSQDSNEEMLLLFSGDELAAIILTVTE